MLLDANEILVAGGHVRLLDCVIARLDLRCTEKPPSLTSTVFAVVSLGDISAGVLPLNTTGFKLAEISGHERLHEMWRVAHAEGRYEQEFLDFLLRWIRATSEVRLLFTMDGGLIRRFSVSLGTYVELAGRFPEDQDYLQAYFGAVLTETD